MKSLPNTIRFFLLSTLIASIYNLLSTNKALAWFSVCNQTSQNISVAFGYLNRPDNRDTASNDSHVETLNLGDPNLTGWIAVGWYNLNPGQCNQVYPHELWRRNRYYYVYATSSTLVWQGNTPFCIDPNNGFNIAQRSDTCNGSLANFNQVDIGNGNVQNYTYNINP